MPVIDVQVHAYERNHPERPWAGHLHGPQSANGEEMVAAMDAVGVDAAIIVSTFNLYRYDPSYALEVYRKYPERFRVVKPIDVTDPAIDDVVADWAKIKGAVGVRIMLRDELLSDPADPRLTRAFAAAGKHGLPVNFLCWGRLDDGTELVKRNPDTVVVIDHLGLLQPNEPPPLAEPWADLPKLLALAAYPNTRVKISGACTLSRGPYPYNDIWDPVLKIIDAFGVDRCMWGTDWTRTSGMLTYEQGVRPFRETARLSDGDRAKLMGGTLEKVYKWAASS
jgi:L-fuconolactonase